ncbi:MAG TPA: ABC transporter substrate-binding protein, partial [Pseudolysinimonas sp.]|nr:ABC transporter substrate-binding protein [Pseudolysinimonas sp.]
TIQPGTQEIVPDIAAKAAFAADGDYVVTLRRGLTFANGHRLDASDVVFSFTRQRTIHSAGGPSPLLAGIASVTASGRRTVEFHLTHPGDPRFPELLTSIAGTIVDEQTFSATALTPDAEIVARRSFAGPYTVESLNPGDLLTLAVNPGYRGGLGRPRNQDISLKLYDDPAHLATDVAEGTVDIAVGGLAPAQLRSLATTRSVTTVQEPGGALHSIVFDQRRMPFGTARPDADPDLALGIRQALADLIDRAALSDDVFAGSFVPVYGYTPADFPGANPSLRSLYGDLEGDPSTSAASTLLAGINAPVPIPLTIATSPELFGPLTVAEFEEIRLQLEAGGLFEVKIQSFSAADFEKKRAAGEFQASQAVWSPTDTDPAAYRSPFRVTDAAIGDGYQSADADALLAEQASETDPAARAADLMALQSVLAADLPTLPILQQNRIAVVANGVTGVRFDGSPTLRFGSIRRP